MSAALLPLWLALCAGAAFLAVRTLRAARAEPSAPASRFALLAIPLCAVVVAGLAVVILGIAPAVDGDSRMRATDRAEGAPARARLFLRQVRIDSEVKRVGYSPDADVVLPSLYSLTEGVRAWDLLDLERSGDVVAVSKRSRPEPTNTRIKLMSRRTLPALSDRMALARSCADNDSIERIEGAVVSVALCRGAMPKAVLSFEAAGGAVLLTADVWRRGRLEPHHIEIEPEALIQIGAASAAVPGVTVWEVPAPAGRSELFSAPKNLLGKCSSFASSVYSGGSEPTLSESDDAVCVVPFAPPFALEVRRLRPDVAGVTARATWAGGLLMLPLLGFALVLFVRRRSETTRADTSDLLRLSILSVAGAAILAARLLWAHRIDMLRDWDVFGSRTSGNLIAVVCVFAGLSIMAALAAMRSRPHRVLAAIIAFGCAVVLGWFTAPSVLGTPGTRDLAQLALAATLGSVALWRGAAARLFEDSPHRVTVAIAGAALATHVVSPRAVVLKLLLCTVAIVAGYRALRAGLQGGATGRLLVGVITTLAMIASLAVLDTGLAAVLVVPGFFIALAIAGHDALFGAKALTEVRGYRNRQAPLLWLQGGLLGALVVVLLSWALLGLVGSQNPNLARDLTLGAPHLLLVVAALFAAPALVAHRSGDRRTSALFGGAAAIVVVGWFARDIIAELVLSSSAPAAQRYAVIADPGYALLADPRAFLSGITGWAETIFATNETAFAGAGFFGAQLIDPGVLLSVENDYLPVLMLRELGVLGMTLWAVTALTVVSVSWLAGRELTSVAGPAARGRLALVAVTVIVLVYQPLASLGALPLTGVSWLGLGIDSPSDLWMMLGILGFLTCAGQSAGRLVDSRHEQVLRSSRRFIRKERWVLASSGLATVAGVLVIARTATFAVNRPMPVTDSGVASAPFIGLEAALDYARSIRCTVDEDGRLDVFGNPTDAGTARFHESLQAKLVGRTLSIGEVKRHGLLRLAIRDAGAALLPTCEITLEQKALAALRVTPNRPYKASRIRLVSQPMGRAAGDHGELVSGDIAIRLRATAEPLNLPTSAGLYAGKEVELGGGVFVTASSSGVVQLENRAEESADPDHWLFVAKESSPSVGLRPTAERAAWTPVSDLHSGKPVVLARDALIVVGRGSGRNVWLFRAPTTTGFLKDDRPKVGALLADDARSVTGARRRLYVYGNDLPELGWVNPFRPRGSVGLDGWVSAAVSEWNPDEPAPPIDCGSLAPPVPKMSKICRVNTEDDVIECRVSLQPELSIRMRHLTEMVAAAPTDFAGPRGRGPWPVPLRSSFVVMRGDTGEITAQGAFVPGRASPAYAPTTAGLETHLIRLREDRDPDTGVKLPPSRRGESSAEKVEHNRPLAVGSIFKPMLAKAFEQTAPVLSRRLILTGNPTAGGACRGGKAHAIFGHCPPTDTLWNQRRPLSMAGFVGYSANWFMAAIGMVGTSLPDGEAGLGTDGPALALDELLLRDVGDHAPDWALWTKSGDKKVIDANGRVNIENLRSTPMWQRFEAVVGRPLCSDGNKSGCEKRAVRADVCAARGLPISRPSSDLRQLVSLGPDRFDFYPRLRNKERRLSSVPSREYLQFLRGSGVHPIGSLGQVTDAFNRVIFEADRDPLRDGPYRLAASWFPSEPVGEIPAQPCSRTGYSGGVSGGVCEVIRSGTASSSLRKLLDDPTIEIYGAKTGTIDSLGDIAARKKACERFNQGHTIHGKRPDSEVQPFWLNCGTRADVDDSLLVISFAVRTSAGGRIPLTLGLAFQRAGSGFASRMAEHYIALIAEYFGAGEEGLP